MAEIISGTEISRKLRAQIATQVEELRGEGVVPGLAVVLVGNDPASEVYVRNKTRACEQAGMLGRTIKLPADVSRDELFGVIDGLNADPEVHGFLVQLPLPPHLSSKEVLERIRPEKDVDGFHPLNVGRVFVGDPQGFAPATPAGILAMLRETGVPTRGKHVVIIGRSLIVGKPLALLLSAVGVDATVTIAHSRTDELPALARQADILVAAVGKPGLVTAAMVKPGATVIDVGTNRVEDGQGGSRLVGDVDFEAVSRVAGAITPVPGGVGPMTITMLLHNTLKAARQARVEATSAA